MSECRLPSGRAVLDCEDEMSLPKGESRGTLLLALHEAMECLRNSNMTRAELMQQVDGLELIRTGLHEQIEELLAENARLRQQVEGLERERDAFREELKVTENLLDMRIAVIDLIPPCPDHGSQCLPHAKEWIEKRLAAQPVAVEPVAVAWQVSGPYERSVFKDESSAKAFCKGLNEGYGEDAYSIAPLYTAPPAPARHEWLPIETAPKDGTAFLATGLCYGTGPDRFCVEAEYMDGLFYDVNPDYPDALATSYLTHWMPLPAAPPAQEQESDER